MRIAVLIESGFPRESPNLLHIKTSSFIHENYYNLQTIDCVDGLFVANNSTILQKL